MNRNTESHFAVNPTRIDISRSRFDRSSSVKLTFNAGDLIPFYVDEVLPGDTFSIDTSKVIRMQTLLTPIMDNMYCDFYWFFVPNRLVWTHWKEFMGENTQSAWLPSASYSVPQVVAPYGTDNGWNIGTIADYMGVPTGIPYSGPNNSPSINALPFRGYALICNEWFRDENLTDPLVISTSDVTARGSNGGGLSDVALGGLPYKVAKYHDYFTSCLPAPQKGPDVTIPIASGGDLPVITKDWSPTGGGNTTPFYPTIKTSMALSSMADLTPGRTYGLEHWAPSFNYQKDTPRPLYGYDMGDVSSPRDASFYPSNLWALWSDPVSATVNQLRLAFQIQKFYERDARGGTRYIEILKSHFGVTSPDSRLQRPEYLGGNRVPININQVVQQSASTAGGTPQGTFTGVSQTSDVHSDFTHSFTEHGFIFGLMCVRYDHTYQQGLERFWSRKDRFDYYWPVFANIGEQAVLNKEIYCDGSATDNQVFGYQEAWADYRYKPNRVSGEMRSSAPTSLDIWHLADDYSQLPALSDSWIREDSATVDRVLAVTSNVSHQFFADIFIRNRCTRAMPLYSVPGLIDHH